MLACEAIYGARQAQNIQELVVFATGEACPCQQGKGCPLLDKDGCNPLLEVVPRRS